MKNKMLLGLMIMAQIGGVNAMAVGGAAYPIPRHSVIRVTYGDRVFNAFKNESMIVDNQIDNELELSQFVKAKIHIDPLLYMGRILKIMQAPPAYNYQLTKNL